MAEKKKLSELRWVDEVPIPGYSLFIEHEYLRRREYGWRGFHRPLNHTHRILSRQDLKDGLSYAYNRALLLSKSLQQLLGGKERNKMLAKKVEKMTEIQQRKEQE